MFRERILAPEPETYATDKSLAEWIVAFKSRLFDSNESHLLIEIDTKRHPVTIKDLYDLVHLPYEVTLSEIDGKLLIATGITDKAYIHSLRHQKSMVASRFSYHTHTARHENRQSSRFPSIADLVVTTISQPNVRFAIIHNAGATIYQRPSKHPLTGMPLQESSLNTTLASEYLADLFEKYIRTHKVVFHKTKSALSGDKIYADLTFKEQTALQEGFARSVGSVVGTVGWHEKHKMTELLKIVNGK